MRVRKHSPVKCRSKLSASALLLRSMGPVFQPLSSSLQAEPFTKLHGACKQLLRFSWGMCDVKSRGEVMCLPLSARGIILHVLP